jgi:hypothetical protein
LNGITISDVPKQFNQNLKHSIDVPDKDFTIPLEMRGVISFFDSQAVTGKIGWIHVATLP